MKISIRNGKDKIIFASIVLMTVLAFARSFFGFDWSDEAYVIAVCKRVIEGEKYFLDILDPHLFTSVVIYPFIKLYNIAMDGYAGILLYMRIILVLVQSGCSLFGYCSLREQEHPLFYHLIIALIPFFAPTGVRTLSYNTLVFLGGYILMVLLYSHYSFKVRQTAAGIITAIIVFAYPGTVLVIPVLWLYFLRHDKTWKYYIVSGLITGLIFGVFLLAHCSFPDLFTGLRTLTGNPEYKDQTLPMKALNLLTEIYYLIVQSTGIPLFFLMSGITVCLYFLKRKKAFNENIICVLWEGALFLISVCLFLQNRDLRYLIVPSVYGNLLLYILYGKKESTDLWAFALVTALMAAVYAMSDLGLPHAFQESLLLLFFLGRVKSGKVLLLIQVLLILMMNLMDVHRDGKLTELTAHLSEGSAAGLYTTAESAAKYAEVEHILQTLNEEESDGRIVFIRLLPFGYLDVNRKPGTAYVWRYYGSYKISADTDTVVIMKDDYGNNTFYTAEKSSIWKYIRKNLPVKEEYASCEIYRKGE